MIESVRRVLVLVVVLLILSCVGWVACGTPDIVSLSNSLFLAGSAVVGLGTLFGLSANEQSQERAMRSLLVGTLVVVLSASSVLAEEPLAPRQRAEKFLHMLADGGTGPAFDLLFEGSAIPAEKPQAVDALKRQTEAALPLYGKILDFELATEKPFGSSVVLLTYIQRLDKNPLVWRFWFYKPHDRWFLANVLINDEFRGLPE